MITAVFSNRVLTGQHGSYTLEDAGPFTFGRVAMLFRARDASGGIVCVKLFEKIGHDFSLASFRREVQVYARLRHPNVLTLIDHGEESPQGKPFMVLPLCQGGDLSKVMRGRNFFPMREALEVLTQVAAALDHSHASGFIHGDVKPENILFDQSTSHAYLTDFGIAKMFPFVESMTAMRAGAGTTTYLSPEQVRSHQQTPRSDIYSFAVVAYQMLTGTLPFDDKAPMFEQLLAKIEGRIIDPQHANPMLSSAASDALRRGLSINPLERPASARAFCDLLCAADPGCAPAAGEVAPRSENGRIQVFISYSHQDARYLEDDSLLGFLSGLSREGIDFWHDQHLLPGEAWDERIRTELARSRIVLALVSQSFLNSRYCREVEIAQFLEQRRREGLLVFPVILSPCDWKSHPWLASTQFQPTGGKTVETGYGQKGKRAELYLRILEDLRAVAERSRAA